MTVIILGVSPTGLAALALISSWAQSGAYTLGSVTYDATYTSAIDSATVAWPDGTGGTFTSTTINTTFGTVDAYTITYGSPTVLHTVTQPLVTRNSDGLITAQPALTVV